MAFTMTGVGTGGLTTGGAATDTFISSSYTGTGGVITGGTATVSSNVIVATGHGGVFSGGRSKRHWEQGIEFEYAKYEEEVTPMDYWKRIEKAIEDAKQREKKLFIHKASGGIKTSLKSKSRVVIVHHDLPDSKVIVKATHQISDKIKIEVQRLFNNDLTTDEILALDDMLIQNDILNRGDYELYTGDKNRFRYRGKAKKASGEATSVFKPASAKVEYFDQVNHLRLLEDDELLFGKELKTTLSQEDEELELLGLLD